MTLGAFIYVVGPSGAGKDSLIDGARTRLPDERFIFARRTITRPAGAGGEDHCPCTPEEFEKRKSAGEFLISWQAHDLSYGLPLGLKSQVEDGKIALANGSRNLVAELSTKVKPFFVIEVGAPPEVLATRLAARGRESAQNLAQRLARSVNPYPLGITVLHVNNDQTLEVGIERFLAAIEHIRLTVTEA
jgi:thymidine phosphorylase